MKSELTYKKAGVNINAADAAKRLMASSVDSHDKRLLNSLGAFASILDGRFAHLRYPVLVFKTEEPGSKQKLAFEHGSLTTICYDLIHHLINDVIATGARPYAAQDLIVCGKIDKGIVVRLVESMAKACKQEGCLLVGGETSEQPGVLPSGGYILAASMIGVVEKRNIIDGSRIRAGDVAICLPSNGLHTNGYSLVRHIIDQAPSILRSRVGNRAFLKAILEPHLCYHKAVSSLAGIVRIKGIAHITGGGIAGNLRRILPSGIDALVDLSSIHIPAVFRALREHGNLRDSEMLKAFNMGVGMVLVTARAEVPKTIRCLERSGFRGYVVGVTAIGTGQVRLLNRLQWTQN